MYLAAKRLKELKEIGKTNMIVGVVAYYRVMQICQRNRFLMHRDQRFHPKAVPPLAYQAGDNYTHLPVPSSFPELLPPDELRPVYGVEFQPSEACPKNFVIVDQTDHRSQIMFNPAFAHKFPAANFNGPSRFMHENFERKDVITLEKELSFLKEDSDDIDVLLSLDNDNDNDEDDVYDEDEVSTARTYGTYGSSSPDSCSNYDYNNSRSNACSSSAQKSSGGNTGEKKQLKMKRMVKALRGIVPGAEQMNTVTVIDEAVRYLKSLKVEAEKLGVDDLEDYN
ncbi:Transcription factor bHLH144 [Linum perenne]